MISTGVTIAPEDTATGPAAVLFDRDGTLVVDVPYNGDPTRVEPMPDAAAALALLRARGIPVGVVTNQAGIARGLLTEDAVRGVNARVEELLGPFAVWQVCPHGPSEGCRCRKPEPGMVLDAAAALGVPAARVALVGDIGADVAAAEAAGGTGVLVPTPATRVEEVRAARVVCRDLLGAVHHLLGHHLLGHHLLGADAADPRREAAQAAAGEGAA